MYLPLYILSSFFLRIWLFLKHWYFDGFFFITEKTISILGFFDQLFALKSTLLNLFRPLYQDYSLVGQIIGPIFRFLLLILGIIIYLAIIIISLIIFIIWAAIPLVIIFSAFPYKYFHPLNLIYEKIWTENIF